MYWFVLLLMFAMACWNPTCMCTTYPSCQYFPFLSIKCFRNQTTLWHKIFSVSESWTCFWHAFVSYVTETFDFPFHCPCIRASKCDTVMRIILIYRVFLPRLLQKHRNCQGVQWHTLVNHIVIAVCVCVDGQVWCLSCAKSTLLSLCVSPSQTLRGAVKNYQRRPSLMRRPSWASLRTVQLSSRCPRHPTIRPC